MNFYHLIGWGLKNLKVPMLHPKMETYKKKIVAKIFLIFPHPKPLKSLRKVENKFLPFFFWRGVKRNLEVPMPCLKISKQPMEYFMLHLLALPKWHIKTRNVLNLIFNNYHFLCWPFLLSPNRYPDFIHENTMRHLTYNMLFGDICFFLNFWIFENSEN